MPLLKENIDAGSKFNLVLVLEEIIQSLVLLFNDNDEDIGKGFVNLMSSSLFR